MTNFLASIVSLAALALAPPTPPAKYIALKPHELALRAEWIVEGTIIQCDDPEAERAPRTRPTFLIQVDELIAGELTQGTVRVYQFEDWACASRYAPYEVGQRALFFLRAPRDKSGNVRHGAPLFVMSRGNEGEAPVADHHVLHRAFGWRTELPEHHVFGHPYWGYASPRGEFIDAVRELRRLYRWEPHEVTTYAQYSYRDLQPLVSEHEFQLYAQSSQTARLMLKWMRAEIRQWCGVRDPRGKPIR